MTGTQLAALIRYKTNTNTTTFTDSDMLVLVNVFIDDIGSKIAEKNQSFFAVPATEDFVKDVREYAFPTDVMNNIIKVEAKFASGDSYFPIIAIKDYRGSETESEIVKNYANLQGEAFYIIRRRAFLILSGSIIAVTDGIRIWYIQFPADLANVTGSVNLSIDPTTTTAGFPQQFHELLARRVGMEKKMKTPGAKFNKLELKYDIDLKVQLDAIANLDLGLEIIGQLPSAEDMWGHGANL